MKFIVYRDTWLRGRTDSALHIQGQRCCLGFLGLACGYTDEEMDMSATPDDVCFLGNRWPKALVSLMEDEESAAFCDSHLCSQIMGENDGGGVTEAEREARLTALFAKGGIEVEFRDGAGP